jgi:GxxExxY protein
MEVNELTFQIRAAVFEVNRESGAGFLEKVYENALVVELKNRGIKAEAQVPVKVRYIKRFVL